MFISINWYNHALTISDWKYLTDEGQNFKENSVMANCMTFNEHLGKNRFAGTEERGSLKTHVRSSNMPSAGQAPLCLTQIFDIFNNY